MNVTNSGVLLIDNPVIKIKASNIGLGKEREIVFDVNLLKTDGIEATTIGDLKEKILEKINSGSSLRISGEALVLKFCDKHLIQLQPDDKERLASKNAKELTDELMDEITIEELKQNGGRKLFNPLNNECNEFFFSIAFALDTTRNIEIKACCLQEFDEIRDIESEEKKLEFHLNLDQTIGDIKDEIIKKLQLKGVRDLKDAIKLLLGDKTLEDSKTLRDCKSENQKSFLSIDGNERCFSLDLKFHVDLSLVDELEGFVVERVPSKEEQEQYAETQDAKEPSTKLKNPIITFVNFIRDSVRNLLGLF